MVAGPILDVDTVMGALALTLTLDEDFLRARQEVLGDGVELSVFSGGTLMSSTLGDSFDLPENHQVAKVGGTTYTHQLIPLDSSGSTMMVFSLDRSQSEEVISSLSTLLVLIIIGAAVILTIINFVGVGRIIRTVRKITGYADMLADGDLRITFDRVGDDECGHLTKAFEKIRDALTQTAHRLQTLSTDIFNHAEALSVSTEALESGAERQTSQVQQVAQSTVEMASSAEGVSDEAHRASEHVKVTLEHANKGMRSVEESQAAISGIMDTVQDLSHQITKLGERSNEIGQIVSVIQSIAEQTNLLALNAAIEAARAGEQGRGFAVVADEVRNLAARTGAATREIKEMIDKIQQETQSAVQHMATGRDQVAKGVDIIGLTKEAVCGILEFSQQSGNMALQIAVASSQQATTANSISISVEDISEVIDHYRAETQRVTSSAVELKKQAKALDNICDWFKT